MSDEINLMKAVVASPEDDLSRLVYADWLEERGKALLAEFIRTQVEIAKSPATRPVLYLTEFKAPDKNNQFVRAKIKNAHRRYTPSLFEMIYSTIDWCLGLTINPTKVSDYWPIRGTGVLESAAINPVRRSGVMGVEGTYDLELNIIPVAGQEDHWVIRDRLQKLKVRQVELWQEPEVINHYNQLSNFRTNGSSHVVLEWNVPGVYTPNHPVFPGTYLLGLVRRGMIEEVKLPIEEWTRNQPNPHCQACDGHGQCPQHHGPDDNYEIADCPYCPTLGQLLVQAHPIKKVWASDRQPYVAADGTRSYWYDGDRRPSNGVHPESNLPTEVYQKLKGGNQSPLGFRVYDTKPAATDDLSQALLSLANPKAT